MQVDDGNSADIPCIRLQKKKSVGLAGANVFNLNPAVRNSIQLEQASISR